MDTVGDADRYNRTLSQRFSSLKFTGGPPECCCNTRMFPPRRGKMAGSPATHSLVHECDLEIAAPVKYALNLNFFECSVPQGGCVVPDCQCRQHCCKSNSRQVPGGDSAGGLERCTGMAVEAKRQRMRCAQSVGTTAGPAEQACSQATVLSQPAA